MMEMGLFTHIGIAVGLQRFSLGAQGVPVPAILGSLAAVRHSSPSRSLLE